ncbi:uncharacterized protein LOC121858536 [Homarus americanus]|uniref:Putative Sleepless protein domain-containing protein 3 n=1 Tax=Homarus americanus TaxID=6706 RepID=A0A8J5TI30_HOMAM|nr:uncharacterized protein LOC121858536 [Homarus americanus]KAG7175111.1 putative Sleepless protein domain-containing protein 3 [Homarus americanus]
MVVVRSVVLLLLMLQDVLVGGEEQLWCYECGTGVAGQPTCEDFARASSWTNFWRKCPKDYVCVKAMPKWAMTNESHIVRGCTLQTNLRGDTHLEGCWSHFSSAMIFCFCNTDRCNHARTSTPTILTLTILLALCVGLR